MSIRDMEKLYLDLTEQATNEKIRVIIFTDCSNAHSAIHSVQPRSVDRSTKILLNYIRDHLQYCCLCFTDAGFNIADLGTKSNPNKTPWFTLVEKNKFKVGFMGRAMYKEYQQNQTNQTENNAPNPAPQDIAYITVVETSWSPNPRKTQADTAPRAKQQTSPPPTITETHKNGIFPYPKRALLV